MKIILFIVIMFFIFSTVSCNVPSSSAVPSSNISLNKEVTNYTIPHYQIISTARWQVEEGVTVEAKLETVDEPMKDASKEFPISRLTLTNLANGRIIYSQDEIFRPSTMYLHNFGESAVEGLVIIWYGAVADRIEILSVNATEAHQVLYTAYRFDATFVSLSNESVDVLITTADGGSMPLYTVRYIWKEDKYEPASKVPYKDLAQGIEMLFSRNAKSRAP